MNAALKEYIEKEIIPRYNHFDRAHSRSHVETVIAQSMELAQHYNVDASIVYATAAYHDTGLCEGREQHHTASARIVRSDATLPNFFTPEEIDTIAQAVEDHRASSKHPPRNIYGRIVAEADRIIDNHTIITRTIQYGLANYPTLTKKKHIERAMKHLKEKYGRGGYLKLWIPESPNAERLEKLRSLIDNKDEIYKIIDEIYETECHIMD